MVIRVDRDAIERLGIACGMRSRDCVLQVAGGSETSQFEPFRTSSEVYESVSRLGEG
jgi:hypothetical protein